MAIQSSGPISKGDLQTEFGGSNPISISEYYRGGIYVPDNAGNIAVPLSGAIKMSDFYGAAASSAFVLTVTEGTDINGNTQIDGYTWSPLTGSRSPTSYLGYPILSANVTRLTIKSNGSTNFKLQFGEDGSGYPTASLFTSIDVEGGGNLLASNASVTLGIFTWLIDGSVTTAWPTWDGTGTRTVTINE
ncbi:MAG: hypothetical protein HRT93_03025 [Piscirickettsiaceae bacterium]|nr:hypothetical protein [Piscirickettsiaceae bacterium]